MYICLDMGGTNIRGTWIGEDGQKGQVKLMSRPHDLEGTKKVLILLIREIQSRAKEKIKGIGLASAGPLDHKKKAYLRTSNMPELDYFQIGDFLEKSFRLPVLMENDAQAAALGEVWMGGLAGSKEAVVLTLGTGVGSGVVLEDKIWRGRHFTGPELGHLFLGPRTNPCGCGQFGCAESWLNKQALSELFWAEGWSFDDVKEIYPMVESKEKQSQKIMKTYGYRLGQYLTMLQVVFGCPNICLSGGLSAFVPFCLDYVWEKMRDCLVKREWWLPERIEVSPDPEMSALYGMVKAWLVYQKEGEY